VVRAADIEGLLKKYVEENSLERADALYLLATVGKEEAAKTLRARYGAAGALSSVLEDLKALGVESASTVTEDTDERFEDAVSRSFESLCLRMVLENAKLKAQNISRTVKEILYILSVFPHESIDPYDIPKFYRIIFQKNIDRPTVERALKELVGCFVIQKFEYGKYGGIRFPLYIDDVLSELRDFIPRVEVKVSWPKKEV